MKQTLSPTQTYLIDVLGINKILLPCDYVPAEHVSLNTQGESTMVPHSRASIESASAENNYGAPVVEDSQNSSIISNGKYRSRIVFVVPQNMSSDQKALLSKIIGASKLTNYLTLEITEGAQLQDELSQFVGRYGLIFGESLSQAVFGGSKGVSSDFYELGSKNFIVTYPIEQLSQGPSMQANKKQTWEHLKKIIKEIK